MKIGIFGCTADPFTIAHKAIVEKVLDEDLVDEVLIVPTIVTYHRVGKTAWLDDFQKIDNSNKLDYEMIYQDYSENENSCIAKIDFEEAIETFVCTNATKQLSKTIFVKSIFTEICNRFMFWYNFPFFCKQNDNYSLNLFIPSKIELPNELLLTHIIFNLKDILDNCAEIINIEIFKINQKEDIQKFLES